MAVTGENHNCSLLLLLFRDEILHHLILGRRIDECRNVDEEELPRPLPVSVNGDLQDTAVANLRQIMTGLLLRFRLNAVGEKVSLQFSAENPRNSAELPVCKYLHIFRVVQAIKQQFFNLLGEIYEPQG